MVYEDSNLKLPASHGSEANLFPNIRFVLVETSHPGNIGAAARAMKNMGINRLYLVAPRQFPDEKAIWRSAGAEDLVRAARVVDTLDEALEGCQLVIGTSARQRRIPWPLLAPKDCGQKAVAADTSGIQIALVFGREAHGLSNEELQKCHFHVKIPTSRAYSSLNLGMAVQILGYEILQTRLGKNNGDKTHDIVSQSIQDKDMDYASADAIERMLEHLEQTLVDIGFHDMDNPGQLMTRLRRMFNRIHLEQMEVSILRGILTAVNQRIGP